MGHLLAAQHISKRMIVSTPDQVEIICHIRIIKSDEEVAMSRKLISINQAVKRKIDRLRKPTWANKMDHFKLYLFDEERIGPWIQFYSPFNKECNGRDPVDILLPIWVPNMDIKEFEVYKGPLPKSEEYREAVATYEGWTMLGTQPLGT